MHSVAAVIRENKPNIAGSTLTTYVYNIMRLKRAVNPLTQDNVRAYLEKLDSPTVAQNLVSALVAYAGDSWSPLHAIWSDRAESLKDTQQLTDREATNWVDAKALRRMLSRMREDIDVHNLWKRKQLSERHFRLLQAYLVFSIHKEFHLRNDLPSVQVVRTTSLVKPTGNYFVLSRNTFLFNRFKTYRYFQRRHQLPVRLSPSKRLTRLIRAFIKRFPGERLLRRGGGGGL